MNVRVGIAMFVSVLALVGCAESMPSRLPAATTQPTGSGIVIAHIQTLLLGPSPRAYAPRLEFLELEQAETKRRVRADVMDDESWLVLALEPGPYRVTRLRIQEGPYAAMADVDLAFAVAPHRVSDLGIWRIGVDPPQVQRTILLSVTANPNDGMEFLSREYPTLAALPNTAELPTPVMQEARLYEASPYPLVRYFRRHW